MRRGNDCQRPEVRMDYETEQKIKKWLFGILLALVACGVIWLAIRLSG